jgi:hypothetical protein
MCRRRSPVGLRPPPYYVRDVLLGFDLSRDFRAGAARLKSRAPYTSQPLRPTFRRLHAMYDRFDWAPAVREPVPEETAMQDRR